MTLTHHVEVRPPPPPDRRRWRFAAVAGLVVVGVLVVVVALVILARPTDHRSASPSDGSGVSVTDRRDVGQFTGVELAGANTVVVRVGGPQAVAVSGDDNLVDRVTTEVRDGRLVVGSTGSFSTKAPMRVVVSTPTLDGVVLSGAGTVTVDGVDGDTFAAELAGSGTLTVSGSARTVRGDLAGTGTLDLSNLVAADASAGLGGTGTIRVHATSTLDAVLSGTGTILYTGDPTVTMRNTGTGSVVPG